MVKSHKVLAIITIMLLMCLTGAYAKGPVTLSFWHIWSGERLELVDEIVSRFETLYPWITVDAQLLGGSSVLLRDKLVASMVGGSPPDVAMVGRDLSVELGLQQGMRDLREFIVADGIDLENVFYPQVIDSLTDPYGRTECIYYLPQLIDAGHYLYYNKGLLNEAAVAQTQLPMYWSELEQLGKKLVVADADGNLRQIGIDVFEQKAYTQYVAWVNATQSTLFSPDRRTVLLGADSPAVETLAWMLDFTNEINQGKTAVERLHTWDFTRFVQGKSAMTLAEDYRYYMVQKQAPNMAFGLAPTPSKDGCSYIPELRLTWGYGIPASSQHPEEAWLFLKFLTMELEGGGWFVMQQGRPGAAISFNLQEEFFEINPYLPVIGENIATSIPSNEPSIDWSSIIADMLGQVVRNETSPVNAAENARKLIQNRLDEFSRH